MHCLYDRTEDLKGRKKKEIKKKLKKMKLTKKEKKNLGKVKLKMKIM